MRIIAGIHKGKRIVAPRNLPIRPTTDMAKESLFNIINNHFYFDQIRVLDLFAGMGSISYEFGSRGVPSLTAVDAHHGCVKFINKTANELSLPITAVKADVFKFLDQTADGYDLIFADPPYDMPQEKFKEIISQVFENNWLNAGGMLIIEHSKHTDLSDHEYYFDGRKYGGNSFSFYELPASDEEE